MNLLEVNAGSRYVRGENILIYGSCIENEHPWILKETSKDKNPLSICLEKEHMNAVVYKLASMFKLSYPPNEFTVLTIDGSPHCIQLHYAVEEACKLTGQKIPIKHLVILNRKVFDISPYTVKLSRYLSKIKNEGQ